MKAQRFLIAICLFGVAACQTLGATPQPSRVPVQDRVPSDEYGIHGLTESEIDTLVSLKLVDDYPLLPFKLETP